MARVTWSRQALLQLNLIRAYIEQFDPRAADRIANRLLDAGDSLAEFPDRGRKIAGGRRQLVTVRPYLIRYRTDAEGVSILDIRHGAQHLED